jgi:hypothetical protein
MTCGVVDKVLYIALRGSKKERIEIREKYAYYVELLDRFGFIRCVDGTIEPTALTEKYFSLREFNSDFVRDEIFI